MSSRTLPARPLRTTTRSPRVAVALAVALVGLVGLAVLGVGVGVPGLFDPPVPAAVEVVRPAALEQPARRPVDGATAAERAERRATVRALAVLHRWDARRAAAWERGDLGALARLYTARSLAGRRDVALLRQYVEQDRPVSGEPPRVLRADLEGGAAGTLRLRVVEQGDAQRRPDERVVVLVRREGAWLVDQVLAR